MTDVQIGRILRALRLRRRVRQADVGSAGGVSQSTISLIERGHLDRLSLDTLRRVFAVLDARLEATVTWRGAAIDTLLDEEHARIVRLAVERLVRLGWETAVEVTYARYGERGSIDVLAGKRSEGAVVVVEVKSVIGGLEETGRKLDEKGRLAPGIAEQRFGWRPGVVGRLLVLPSTATARRQARRHAVVLDALLPSRGSGVTSWLRRPEGQLRGLLFVSDTNGHGVSHKRITRVRVRSTSRRCAPARIAASTGRQPRRELPNGPSNGDTTTPIPR